MVLVLWVSAALLFGVLPENFAGRVPIALVVYWTAAAFTATALANATLRMRNAGRVFWALLAGGLLLRFVGSISRTGFQTFELVSPVLAFHDMAYAASYLLLFCAFLWLVAKTTKRITLVAALDSLSAMLSIGVLVWYFILGPTAYETGLVGYQEMLVALTGPVFDVGLLCLSLVIVSAERRSSFASVLVGAFGAFLIADGFYLRLRSIGSYEIGNWPELFWALGIALFGVAALKTTSSNGFAPPLGINPWKVFAFWFSPLSPAMHYAFLLVWSSFNPPLPTYVIWAGAVLVLYFAFRISMASYVSRKLRSEAESEATRAEKVRLVEDLHDNLKQSVYRTSLLLGTYRRSLQRDHKEAGKILDQIIEASRDANRQVSRPIEELRVPSTASAQDLAVTLGSLLREMREVFGIESYTDLKADLGALEAQELAAAHRIATEALWNVAKHSGAHNVWLDSREVGSFILIKIRDDGCGFSEDVSAGGVGLSLIRSRAEEAGGKLDVISNSLHGGTTVQVSFKKR